MHQRLRLIVLLAAVPSLGFQVKPRPPEIAFQAHTIDLGASETAAAADINHDGRLDIVSGEHWYEAPSWTKHRFRDLNFVQQYIDDFSDLPIDVDRDGYPDIVSVSWFAKRVAWWRNPGRTSSSALWNDADIHAGFNIEFAILADMDNDGRATEIVAQENGTGQSWYEARDGAFIAHVVSDRTYGHGIGAGDINKDGRTDVLTPRGWLEAPADPRAGNWTFHPDWESANTTAPGEDAHAPASTAGPQLTALGFMHAADINGDGRNDVIAGSAHDYGVFWFEHTETGPWVRRTVDNAWSQAHASTLVDLNGDDRLDFVTGKRFMAHNGGDPGEREPLGLYWYEHRPAVRSGPGAGSGGVEWVRHVIEYGGRIGGGMQIPVVDIDQDGDLDLVCAGKSGLFLIENRSQPGLRPGPRLGRSRGPLAPRHALAGALCAPPLCGNDNGMRIMAPPSGPIGAAAGVSRR
jgi:VCBS repeat protein